MEGDEGEPSSSSTSLSSIRRHHLQSRGARRKEAVECIQAAARAEYKVEVVAP